MNDPIKKYAAVYSYRIAGAADESEHVDYFQVDAYSAADAATQAELLLRNGPEFDHLDSCQVLDVRPYSLIMQTIIVCQNERREVASELRRRYLKP